MKVTYSNGSQEIWDPNTFRNHGLARFQNWLCWASSSSLNITADGDVTAGICQSQNFGNIFDPKSLTKPLTSPFVCPKEFCTASPDIEAKKENSTSSGRISKIEPTSNRLCINWDISRHCNYDCWYCTPEFHDNSNFFRSKDLLLEAWANFSKKLLKEFLDGAVRLHLLGGEPTLHPNYIEIVEKIKKSNIEIVTMTNGSNSLSFYKDLLKLSNVTISVHFDFIKAQALSKKILDLASFQELHYPNKNFIIKIMAQPGKVQTALDFHNRLKREGMSNLSLEVLSLRDPKTDHLKPVKYNEHEANLLKNIEG